MKDWIAWICLTVMVCVIASCSYFVSKDNTAQQMAREAACFEQGGQWSINPFDFGCVFRSPAHD